MSPLAGYPNFLPPLPRRLPDVSSHRGSGRDCRVSGIVPIPVLNRLRIEAAG